jgi:L-alanine-DL-glutamate epimerase-like enolase superfamily enzyme
VVVAPLAAAVLGRDAADVGGAWVAMRTAVRNIGLPGLAACAISALDNALWDLKARLLGLPVGELLGLVRDGVPAYGSGGFTSYTVAELQAQLAGWAEEGVLRVKMKVGRDPAADAQRVAAARAVIGDGLELFVDANGGYGHSQALAQAGAFAASGVTWFEEPVSSDDLEGLAQLRARMPAGMSVTAGEYGYEESYFRRMLLAAAVDVLQADATRCCGTSGFLRAAALAEAFHVPLSAHTAPALHAPLCCAAPAAIHIEWFFDHVRIEALLFDGAPRLKDGNVAPDPARPGFGLELRTGDAERYRVAGPLRAPAR